ncbi:MAG: hypothetical protein JW867_03945, partial [Candidatus Omnitrophica bacterium]|nr:hypothetical protein [Candidatus Omnitrophota bacterium]
NLTRSKNKLFCYKALSLILFLIVIIQGYFLGADWFKKNWTELGLSTVNSEAPYHDQIKEIIAPLRYSAIEDFLSKEVGLSLNFTENSWTLLNARTFDEQGNVVLKDGRYGICGVLAAYVYQKILPLLSEEFKVDFVRVAASGYFLTPKSTHYALLITERPFMQKPRLFLLDPSFRKYGDLKELSDYYIFETVSPLPFLETKERNKTFEIKASTPLLIKKQELISLVVDGLNNKYDKKNFLLAITATKRTQYFGRFLVVFYQDNGMLKIYENKFLAHSLLGKNTYDALYKRLLEIHNKIIQ